MSIFLTLKSYNSLRNLGDNIELKDANPKLTTLTGCLIGLLLIDSLSTSEQNSLGNFLELIGQVLLANASQQALIENRITGNSLNINSKVIKNIYNPLFYDTKKLKDIIKECNQSQDINYIIQTLEVMKNELNELKKEMNN